jgi:hypothetical protein
VGVFGLWLWLGLGMGLGRMGFVVCAMDGIGRGDVLLWDMFHFFVSFFEDGVGQNSQSVPSISKTIPCNAGPPSVAGWPRGAKRRLLGCCEEAILIAANGGNTKILFGLKSVLQRLFRSSEFSVRMDIAVIWLLKFKKCCQ